MPATRSAAKAPRIPKGKTEVDFRAGRRAVRLTSLDKTFWPRAGLTKRDLLQYYADVSSVLLPHLRGRAMVMKRYPNGIRGKWFFMKRAPSPRPEWIETCEIMHKSNNLIAFPMVQDLASLLWVVNLGCIDLNPWYGRCDDPNRPDCLVFDLDPGPEASFQQVLETGLVLRDAVEELGMRPLVKTSGSEGLHLYIPIVRGPVQKDVWGFAKRLAKQLEGRHPGLITTEFFVAKRPPGRVLWTTTRMPGVAPWPRSTRCGRRRSPAPRRRSRGRKWSGASRSPTSGWRICPRACGGAATSGSLSSPRGGASSWSRSCEPPDQVSYPSMEADTGRYPPGGPGLALRAEVGRLPETGPPRHEVPPLAARQGARAVHDGPDPAHRQIPIKRAARR
jgi:bifunctional non-homologous end joining protein LigD